MTCRYNELTSQMCVVAENYWFSTELRSFLAVSLAISGLLRLFYARFRPRCGRPHGLWPPLPSASVLFRLTSAVRTSFMHGPLWHLPYTLQGGRQPGFPAIPNFPKACYRKKGRKLNHYFANKKLRHVIYRLQWHNKLASRFIAVKLRLALQNCTRLKTVVNVIDRGNIASRCIAV